VHSVRWERVVGLAKVYQACPCILFCQGKGPKSSLGVHSDEFNLLQLPIQLAVFASPRLGRILLSFARIGSHTRRPGAQPLLPAAPGRFLPNGKLLDSAGLPLRVQRRKAQSEVGGWVAAGQVYGQTQERFSRKRQACSSQMSATSEFHDRFTIGCELVRTYTGTGCLPAFLNFRAPRRSR
jgi:hypothetical protein